MEALLGAAAKEVVSALISAVLNKAGPSLLEFLRASSKLNSSVEKLVETLSNIGSVLEKADEELKWLNGLKDAVYEAEGVLDEMEYERLKRQVRSVKTPLPLIQFSFLHKVREIQEKLDNCLKTAYRIGTLSVNSKSKKAVECSNPRETVSRPDSCSRLIGRVGEKEFIINWLLNGHTDSEASSANVHQDTPVLPIWGMGGIGKTTIAQQVFNDDRVQTYFKSWRAWVYVSEKFDVNKIIKDIIQILSLSNENGGGDSFQSTTTLEVLQVKLGSILQGKMFLIVLDDVWNEEPEMWIKLCKFFSYGKPGSKILVTCRSEKIASLVATNREEKQYIDSLDESNFWELFKMHAFGDHSSGSQSSPELEIIGRKIADKLRGSPLAAKTLGRILKENLNTAHWTSVAGSELWGLKQDQSGIMPALLLSYKYLPEHLKLCFTYFASIPRGGRFRAKELIRRYIAIEFVETSNSKEDQFSIGLKYVKQLLNRSMFQKASDQPGLGYDSMIGIHDLLHDLARMVTKDDIFVIKDGTSTTIPKGLRHLSIFAGSSLTDWLKKIISQVNIEALHSIMIVEDGEYDLRTVVSKEFCEVLNIILAKGINLKMICLEKLWITRLTDSIAKSKRLRYLRLRGTAVTTLPKALARLYHLKSLDIKDCSNLQILPKQMENLDNLIDFEGRHDLLPVKCFRQLQNVDKLIFKLSSKGGQKVRDLGGLRGIRWLKIEGLENISCKEEAMEANLEQNTYLDTLVLTWSVDESLSSSISNPENILEGLQPSPRLRSLEIANYRGAACPGWIVGHHLPNLQSIEFSRCTRLKQVSFLGEFSKSIQSICLINCEQLQGTSLLGNDNFFPPCLKYLYISHCGEFGNSLQWTHLVHLKLLQNLLLLGCGTIEYLPIRSVQSLKGLTSLERMYITECPKLMDDLVATRFALPSPLNDLTIGQFPKDLMFFVSVRQLSLYHSENLTSLPTEVFLSLGSLFIDNCPKLSPPMLSNEELQSLRESGLTNFHISHANMASVKRWLLFLMSFSISKLVNLLIGSISDLQSFSDGDIEGLLAGLHSLSMIQLNDLEHIRLLPSNLREHPSLRFLAIRNCPNIKTLSASMFAPFTKLKIHRCPDLLKRLPKKQFVEVAPSVFVVNHTTATTA